MTGKKASYNRLLWRKRRAYQPFSEAGQSLERLHYVVAGAGGIGRVAVPEKILREGEFAEMKRPEYKRNARGCRKRRCESVHGRLEGLGRMYHRPSSQAEGMTNLAVCERNALGVKKIRRE